MSNSSKRYPVSSQDYEVYEEIGEGCSATVYRAYCIPLDEIVAIKILDLERCRNELDIIRREVLTMSLTDHPNLLKANACFMDGTSLWVVMPFMSDGSCFHIMKSSYPDGFEQPVIATLLREVLKALEYLHAHGHIHRDVKAGNILIDSKGGVKLGDFGVSACMFDNGERQHNRNTFVGTPCWMAPEVMQQLPGYDFKADIWSFGITALELAHGHAPFSKYPPMKVLMMTLQNAPPRLEDKKFSKSFKEIVAACLVKDPKKRPSSTKLLKHPFFKYARSSEYLEKKILTGLCPLGDRYRVLKEKEANLIVQNKGFDEDKEQLSQQEYMRGISGWNFDLEDLKKEAALIQEDDNDQNPCPNPCPTGKQTEECDNIPVPTPSQPMERSNNSNSASSLEDDNNWGNIQFVESSAVSFPLNNSQQTLSDLSDTEMDESNSSRKYNRSSTFRDPNDRRNSDTPTGFISSILGQSFNSMSNTSGSILQMLQCLLQQNAMQREQVTRLIRYIERSTGNSTDITNALINGENFQIPSSSRERELQSQIVSLQQSMGKLVEELQRQKTVNSHLERQLSSLSRRSP